jgi:hypothetical protein
MVNSEAVTRRTDNKMNKRKRTIRQTMVDKLLHGKLKIEQHESHKKPGRNSGAPKGSVSINNTVVSNHFHSVKILLFSSARSRDFDGIYNTGLPVSMYTTKTPIDMSLCAVLTFDPQLKNILTFSVKDRYQLNYFICIKDFNAETIASLKLNLFSFFICGCQHHERKTICLYVYISDIRRTERYRTPIFIQPFPWRFHITITYNLRIYDYDMLTLSQ